MSANQSLRRIGIVNYAGWSSAITYTRMLVHSLSSACRTADVELYLFSRAVDVGQLGNNLPVKIVELSSAEYLPGERGARRMIGLSDKKQSFRGESRLRRIIRLPDHSDVFHVAREHQIDVLLPILFNAPASDQGIKTIGWIPDFQHIYLPEYFSRSEREHRDRAIRRMAQRVGRVMLSSQTALEHFRVFAPEYAAKARVVSFPSLFAFEPFPPDAHATLGRYNLPKKFALVANQFWIHKNHEVVIEALRQLKGRDVRVPVVMTGLPADPRDPSNQYFSRLLQSIARAGLHDQIIILGQIDYADLVNLMRTAALFIQPSRFEGWSTIVEDAKALGRPLLCSDLPVHREQAPQALGFFDCDAPEVLAELLAAHWAGLEPGTDPAREEEALSVERDFARLHGSSLLGICQETCAD